MPVSYSVDVLRHWTCTCDESEALAFRAHLAMVGLELPESDVAWSVAEGEEVADSDVGSWQHMVSAVAKAEKDGVSGRGKDELNRVLNHLAIVVATINAREANHWAELVHTSQEVAPEVSAAESHAPQDLAPIEHISPPPTESVNVGEVEQAPMPATESTEPQSEVSE